MKCALCDMRCPGHARLGRHVWTQHRWDEIAGRSMLFNHARSHKFRCWCGAWVHQDNVWRSADDAAIPTLGMHLKDRGGMAAHLLEIGLGLQET